MRPYDALDQLLYRIGFASNALRARADDVRRIEHNGGTSAELEQRVGVLVTRLEKVASELEDALA